MRKLKRSVIRHKAEKAVGYKTIKLFRYLWKKYQKSKGVVYTEDIKVKPRKSMIHRAVEATVKKRERGMSR